jgi:hypothetical protein
MSVTAFFLTVTPRQSGYVATSQRPEIIAMGSTDVVAAENALLAARVLLGRAKLPATIIIRVAEPGCSTVVVQAIDKPIRLDRDNNDHAGVRAPKLPGTEAI